MSDVPDLASREAFQQARSFARKQMNALQGKVLHRAEFEEPIVDSCNLRECVLRYAGSEYSYTCEVNTPLTWHNLRLAAVLFGGDKPVQLTEAEHQKLKQRAFARLKAQRRDTYANDGEGEFLETLQLKLVL
ncbi:MAG: hypothetical protein KGI70_03570 [Patescibacteria group bacterium]|nr:hypothetical protein [Patescibacteria group bacterium]